MAEKIKPHFIVKEERFEKLKQLFPEAVGDGELNWDILREALGEFLEDDSQEHFGLNWPGKKEARKMAFVPPKGTLKWAKGEGVDEEETENLFIEGDNLEVLKLLQKSYFGKIKMIYIDPPYNTGNDFVYNDDFTDTIEDYLRKSGQLDEEGNALSTNPKTSGRFHSNWLSMMYPRLLLAKNLLRDDGVIFVSIDDNEEHNLKEIMNEIFGESNFVANIVWKKKTGAGSQIRHVFDEHEYVIIYAKNITSLQNWRVVNEKDGNFKNPDNDKRGPWESCAITAPSKNNNPNQLYLIEVYLDQNKSNIEEFDKENRKIIDKFQYKTHTIVLRTVLKKDPVSWEDYNDKLKIARFIRRWAYTKDSIKNIFNQEKVYINGKNIPRFKKFEVEYEGKALRSIYPSEFSTQEGSNILRNIFEPEIIPFEYPKPPNLIKHFIESIATSHEIILDFFAGSATTAHSVLKLNFENNLNNKFIIIQIPEIFKASKSKYNSIEKIGKERIRRVIKKLNAEDQNKNNQDRGFKVLKLSKSNIIKWDDVKSSNLAELENQLFDFTEPLAEGWTKEDLLLEVLLWEGFSLTSKMEKKKAGQNTFVCVTDKTMQYKLWACFDKKLDFTIKDFATLGFEKEDIIVFLDSSLTDAIKSRLSDLCRLKVV